MAKITIAGDAIVITSSLKLEDIKTVEKYRPEALVLLDEDGEQVFRVGTTTGAGNITKYGAEFGSETRDDEKKAIMTLVFTCNDKSMSIKEVVADKIGAYVLNLSKVEDNIPAVLGEIKAEKERIMESITIAQ